MRKLGYILYGTAQTASTRISSLNVFDPLRRRGYAPVVLYQPRRFWHSSKSRRLQPRLDGIVVSAVDHHGFGRGDVVFLQKVSGPSALRAVAQFREAGIKTVFWISDYVVPEMSEACDATVVPSQELKLKHSVGLQPRVHYVHDGIEADDLHQEAYSSHYASTEQPLRVVFLSSKRVERIPLLGDVPDFVELSVIGRYRTASSTGWRGTAPRGMLGSGPAILRTSARIGDLIRNAARRASGQEQSGPPFHRLPWRLDTVYTDMLAFDVGIVPVDVTAVREGRRADLPYLKSNNRVTQLMALGLPVIATPLPAYEPIVENGVNGYLAVTVGDWTRALEELRDPGTRERLGRRARCRVVDEFSREEQARKLADVFANLA